MMSAPLDLAALSTGGLGSAPLAGSTTGTVVPSPSPSSNLQQGIDPGDVSPGLLGFLPVFAIALVCIGLFLSLTSKLRKVNRRPEPEGGAEPAAGGDGPVTPAPR